MIKGKPIPKGMHWMLYGPPGMGKTTLISQMPKPVAILDIDKGAGWLYADLDGVDVFSLEEGDDPSKVVLDFVKSMRSGRSPGKDYRSVAIDSLSALRAEHLMHLAGNSDFYELGDYGQATNWLRRVLALSQGCSQMICWVTHMKEDADGPRLVIRPAGMSATALNHCVENLDAIVFMGQQQTSEGPVRVLATQATDVVGGRATILVKDRTGFLPGLMELDGLQEDGTPPPMFYPFFKEVISELGYDKPIKKAASKPKPKPIKKEK